MRRITLVTTILLLGLLFAFTACASPTETPPNFTAQQAIGIVAAATEASTPTIRASSRWFSSEFNYSTRQWMVTVWASEEDSKKYGGTVYIVDDATGKVLNPPPVYTPK